ncbi:pyridoxal-phosphate dependent enzyme [Halobellus sp. H-GB7]|uniref:pyridoxal-phosphate dependent enzyme n=1 Tax=Halobellus sp. H-GB7 TaxID=3069756 RepID=UPI0027ADE598|nr:pyridoxal-phosphate dependent enzyme [Halobellus sp. H-GB7]MDQ2053382.1 pyridoxal-phosphate dependent enzyme [Halobellus sp. H-GB7]
MQTSEAFCGLVCTATDERYDATATGESDAGARLEAAYDYDAVEWSDEALADAPRSMWRYSDLLAFESPVTADEGGTLLVAAPTLAEEVGLGELSIKDESRNPTGTVLDRGLAPAVTAAREADADLVALATPGNAGQSAASYAGMADIRSYAFVPSRAPFSNKAMVNVHGGEMRVAGGRYPDAEAALHEQLQSEWYTLQEFDNPHRHDGIKTVAFEIAESVDWALPDAVVLPAGTGEVVAGVVKGFRELREVGMTDDVPPVYAAQPAGCAPLVAAHDRGADTIEPWESPDTIVGELEIPEPNGAEPALDAVAETGGGFVAVDDENSLESAVVAAQKAGLEVGAAGGVAVAAAGELAADGVFGPDDHVVVVNTESGTKTADVLRSHLMGKGI